MFNKDLEEIKKSQSIMNNAINKIKRTLEGTLNNKSTSKTLHTYTETKFPPEFF